MKVLEVQFCIFIGVKFLEEFQSQVSVHTFGHDILKHLVVILDGQVAFFLPSDQTPLRICVHSTLRLGGAQLLLVKSHYVLKLSRVYLEPIASYINVLFDHEHIFMGRFESKGENEGALELIFVKKALFPCIVLLEHVFRSELSRLGFH